MRRFYCILLVAVLQLVLGALFYNFGDIKPDMSILKRMLQKKRRCLLMQFWPMFLAFSTVCVAQHGTVSIHAP